jgi:hypothetical protein
MREETQLGDAWLTLPPAKLQVLWQDAQGMPSIIAAVASSSDLSGRLRSKPMARPPTKRLKIIKLATYIMIYPSRLKFNLL